MQRGTLRVRLPPPPQMTKFKNIQEVNMCYMILLLIPMFMLFMGFLIAVDSWGRPEQEGSGTVAYKEFNSRKCEWRVFIGTESRIEQISVSHEKYNTLSVDDSVNIVYVTGRFTKDVYLKEIK